jgi:hypothetical protein
LGTAATVISSAKGVKTGLPSYALLTTEEKRPVDFFTAKEVCSTLRGRKALAWLAKQATAEKRAIDLISRK